MAAGAESCACDAIAARRLRDGDVSYDVFWGVVEGCAFERSTERPRLIVDSLFCSPHEKYVHAFGR